MLLNKDTQQLWELTPGFERTSQGRREVWITPPPPSTSDAVVHTGCAKALDSQPSSVSGLLHGSKRIHGPASSPCTAGIITLVPSAPIPVRVAGIANDIMEGKAL